MKEHTCCFSGHRPGKLDAPEEEVRRWLERQIGQAVDDGYRCFITGCAMGVDTWAGQIVLGRKETDPGLRLIAANPWPGMGNLWRGYWREQYLDLLRRADEVVTICGSYHKGAYERRNHWMVDRSARLIAYYNGAPGGTRNTVLYAREQGLEVVTPRAGV